MRSNLPLSWQTYDVAETVLPQIQQHPDLALPPASASESNTPKAPDHPEYVSWVP